MMPKDHARLVAEVAHQPLPLGEVVVRCHPLVVVEGDAPIELHADLVERQQSPLLRRDGHPGSVCVCITHCASGCPQMHAEWMTNPAGFTGQSVCCAGAPSASTTTREEAVISSNSSHRD
jgi:hypothetical protein